MSFYCPRKRQQFSPISIHGISNFVYLEFCTQHTWSAPLKHTQKNISREEPHLWRYACMTIASHFVLPIPPPMSTTPIPLNTSCRFLSRNAMLFGCNNKHELQIQKESLLLRNPFSRKKEASGFLEHYWSM